MIAFAASKKNCCGHWSKESKLEGGKDFEANAEGEIMICDNGTIFVFLYVTGSFMKWKSSTSTKMQAVQVRYVAFSGLHHVIKVLTSVSKLMSFLFEYREV